MRAIVIPVDGSICEAEPEGLEDFQELVGGPIQMVPYPTHSAVTAYVNEEGLLHGLPVNPRASNLLRASLGYGGFVVGDCVLVGLEGDADVDLPEEFTIGSVVARV